MADRFPGTPDLIKVIKELEELKQAPDNEEEAADVFIAFVIWAHRKRVDLPAAVNRKMAVNERRKWGEPDPMTGEVRHLPECSGSMLCVVRSDELRGVVPVHGPECPLHEVSRTSVESAP